MPEHQQIRQTKKPDTLFQNQVTPVSQTHISNPVSVIQRAKINPKSLTHDDILQLQRTIGNRAVGMLLSGIGSSVTAQHATAQRQEIPEEKTCHSCIQKQEIPEEEDSLQRKMIETIQRQEIPEEEEPLQGKMAKTLQLQEMSEEEEPLQGKLIGTIQRQEIPEEEEPLQDKFFENIQLQKITEEEEPLQTKKENNTGLPDNLKASVENLSGIDMSDVRVHYNSSKPAEVGALAYTQGTNIHVAPGQERHLPHEAWHVVQQAQGRVKPTMQTKGMLINDDSALEREADLMGMREITQKSPDPFLAPNGKFAVNEVGLKSLQFTGSPVPVAGGDVIQRLIITLGDGEDQVIKNSVNFYKTKKYKNRDFSKEIVPKEIEKEILEKLQELKEQKKLDNYNLPNELTPSNLINDPKRPQVIIPIIANYIAKQQKELDERTEEVDKNTEIKFQQLRPDEELVVIAHGSKPVYSWFNSGKPELGGFYADELAKKLAGLFPDNYSGLIYLNGCYTGRRLDFLFGTSYIEIFSSALRQKRPNIHSNVKGNLGAAETFSDGEVITLNSRQARLAKKLGWKLTEEKRMVGKNQNKVKYKVESPKGVATCNSEGSYDDGGLSEKAEEEDLSARVNYVQEQTEQEIAWFMHSGSSLFFMSNLI